MVQLLLITENNRNFNVKSYWARIKYRNTENMCKNYNNFYFIISWIGSHDFSFCSPASFLTVKKFSKTRDGKTPTIFVVENRSIQIYQNVCWNELSSESFFACNDLPCIPYLISHVSVVHPRCEFRGFFFLKFVF